MPSQSFTTPGAFTWVAPPGTTSVSAAATGAGAGGQPGGGGITPSYLAAAGGATLSTTTGPTAMIPVKAATAVGDLLVLCAASNNFAISSVADSRSNLWHPATSPVTSGTIKAVLYWTVVADLAHVLTLSDSVSITAAGTGGTVTGLVLGQGQPAGATPLQVAATAFGSSATPALAITPAALPCWLTAFIADSNTGGLATFTPGGPITFAASQHTGSATWITAGDDFPPSTAPLSLSAAITSAAWIMLAVTWNLDPTAIGTPHGGGGGGAGGAAAGTVAVTPATSYPVTVGAGGVAGGGGDSSFSGDSAAVTGRGGRAGGLGSATAGGPGGTGGGATPSGTTGSAGSPGTATAGGAGASSTAPGGAGGTSAAPAGSPGASPGAGGGGGFGLASSGGTGQPGGSGSVTLTWAAGTVAISDPDTATSNDSSGQLTTRGAPGLLGAYVDPAVYGLSDTPAGETTAVNDFSTIVGIPIAVRRSAYGFRVTPVAYDNDSPAAITTGAVFPLMGATTYNGSGYGTSDTLTRCRDFDSAVGRTMALQASKYYLKEGQSFTTATLPGDLAALISAGILLYVCLKPSRTLSASQQSALAGTLDALEASGARYKNILYQEPNTTDFATAAAYQSYCQFYGPVVRSHSGKPIVYDPSSGSVFIDPAVFYPGDQWADEIVTDWYCSAQMGTSPSATLGNLAALADGHTAGSTSTAIGVNGNGTPAPVPFGLGEWGGSAATNTHPTLTQFTAYISYMISFFAARQSAGKASAPLLWFNDVSAANQPDNFIAAGDPKIPQIQRCYDALNGPGTGA